MSETNNTPAAPAGEATPAADVAEVKGEVSGESIDAQADAMLGEEAEIEASEETDEEKKQTKEEKKVEALKKKLKLKVNGKELEEEIDFNDDDRLKRALQKEKAFDMASQELSQLKKQFGGFLEALKGEQVLSVLRELGHDVDKLAEKHIETLVEQAKKSPEQVERERMELELKQLKEEKERLSKEKQEKEMESLRNQVASEIENEITSALEQTTTILPKRNPKVIRSVAANMLFAMQNGYPDVRPSDVIPLVEAEFKRDIKDLMDVLPEDTIELLVGKENFNRVRKKNLKNAKIKTETARQIVKETGEKKASEEESNKNKKSYRDFFGYGD